MSMVTKCPSCATTFRVTPQQLQAHHGMVRCGRCATVFDGFKALATLRDETPAAELLAEAAAVATMPASEWHPAPAAEAPAAPEVMPAAESKAGVESVPPAIESAPPPVAEMPDGQRAELVAATAPKAPPSASKPAPQPASRVTQPMPVAEPFLDEPLPRKGGRGWRLGVLLLLLVLAAQGVYFFRSEVAANVPELRPHLNKMCEFLRCVVTLPQRPRQISIEASDMQATDSADPGRITLTATLRNHAATEIGYPALDVVLTNTKEHTVARRIFLPEEYLGPRVNVHAGIARNAEVTVRLDLDTGDLGAAGFRLDLLPAS